MSAPTTAQAVDAPAWLVRFYRKVDALDAAGVLAGFAPDASMRFGSAEPMVGHDAIRAGLTWIFSNYRRMEHAFLHLWVSGDTVLLEATVTYELLDGRAIPVPALTVIEYRDGLVRDLRIFTDPTRSKRRKETAQRHLRRITLDGHRHRHDRRSRAEGLTRA